KTKREADETGTRIEIEGSELKLQEPCVMQSGTIITVKNIFFNVPARRNFLKATPVEARHVMDEFLRVALPRPEIGFSLQHNGMEVYNLPATHQRQRICQIFGAAYNERLVPVEEDTTILNIKGFVGKPEFAKKVRGEQYFFINKRFVKDAYLNHAVTIAFNELLPQGTFASYFLFFEVDPSRIDVNIHPTKTEVKLEDEKSVYAILRSSVKRALGRFSIAPTLDFNQEQAFNVPLSQLNTIPVQPQVKVNTNYNPFKSVEINKPTQQQNGQWEKLYEIAGLTDVQQTKLPIAPVEENSASAFMQLFNSYIAVAMQDELWLIDQQLAHEKIVFEKTLLQMKGTPTVMQQSLFPLQIELDNRQNATISSLLEDLNHSGFDLQPFGQNTFVLNAVPSYLETGTEKKIIEMLIDEFISGEASAYNPMERVAIAIARSACLKRGKVLSAREMSVLFNDLMQCEMPYFTKSGKAIIFKLEKNEIDRKFEKG
ncbi:MAG TPA: DNA mismatch repair endonuclease MutL, partial [Bacteroidia bacterium]|nr:DNA mismatch repair endonuclease MutL [Bacteroidia bacterium]